MSVSVCRECDEVVEGQTYQRPYENIWRCPYCDEEVSEIGEDRGEN